MFGEARKLIISTIKMTESIEMEVSDVTHEKLIDIPLKTNEQLNQFSNIFLNKIKKDIVINEL